ncbi:MAG: N-acetyltransferase [Ruminococcus sp.]|nr:N-acetyltransferase [Ruminococcus sp.]
MIQQITSFLPTEIIVLERSFRGMQILSYQKAYGGNYGFCRFFRLRYPTGKGWMLLFNATLFICTEGKLPTDEIQSFVAMHMPFRVECDSFLVDDLLQLSSYQKLHRTTFHLVPKPPSDQFLESALNRIPRLDTVYQILKEGFPNLLEYGLWLTDASHRLRHGISKFFTYKDISTLAWQYDWNDTVLVGQVATCSAHRGSGYARDLLRWTANELSRNGKYAVLYALDVRDSFYREIGFQAIATEYVLERQDIPKEKQEKGVL